MKKCLICFVGLYRTFAKTHRNIIDNVVNANGDYEFDVMMSTEKSCRDRYKSWLPQKHYDVSGWKYEDGEKLEKDLNEAYGKIGTIIDLDFFEPNMNDGTAAQVVCERVLRMMNRVTGNYDKVVLLKFDVVLSRPVILDDFNANTFYFFATQMKKTRNGFMGCDFDYMFLGDTKSMELNFSRKEYPKEKIDARMQELLTLTNSTKGEGIYSHLSSVLNLLEGGYSVNVKHGIEKKYLPKIIR
jgi:hypothetical protein